MRATLDDQFTPLIAAYYDGELTEARRAEVEVHLAHCTACQAELQALRSLSTLLAVDLLQADLPLAQAVNTDHALSNQAFAEEVLRRLPQPSHGLARGLKAAWQLTPLGLFVIWAFVQAATWAGGLVLLAGFWPGGPDPRWIELFGALSGLPSVDGSQTSLTLAALVAANLWLTFNLALVFGGWLASWVAYQHRRVIFA